MPLTAPRRELRSAGIDVGNATLDALVRAWKTGTCSYYSASNAIDDCLQPRLCYDCLNTPVDGMIDGCMVNEIGKCVNMDDYRSQLDYRRVEVINNVSVFGGGRVQFPSRNTTYCEYADPQCDYCRTQGILSRSKNLTGDERSRFCVGVDGCVCISVCESFSFSEMVGGRLCLGDLIEEQVTDRMENSTNKFQNSTNKFQNSTENLQNSTENLQNSSADLQNTSEHKGKGPWMVVSVVLGCAVLLLVATVVIYRRRFKSSSSANATSSTSTAPASSSSSSSRPRPNRSLNLFGWQAKRQHLIEKERAELGDSDVVAHGSSYVEFVDVAPSAPDADFVPMAYMASAPDTDMGVDGIIPLARALDDERKSDTITTDINKFM